MTKNIFFLLLISLFPVFQSTGQNFLKTQNARIVNGDKEVILRGIGLGGWMLQEGYMLQIYSDGTQHSIKNRIADLIGDDACNQFYDKWLQNHVTKADIDSLAKWGFNSVRLPMHYNLYTLPIEAEPIKGQNTWLNKGFTMTDSLLTWCKANNMWLILDLHAAPGGQGKDANISDYDPSKPSLWESDENQLKTIALWHKLAQRYANEPAIGAYDILNEPNWTFEGKNKNGLEDTLNQPIWDLYKRITQAIREVDSHHLIFIEGNGWGNNYGGFPGPWDNNMAFSFHKYWNPNTKNDIAGFIAMREKYNMPLWLGESGENSNKWFTDAISLVETNNIGWAWWPLKKIGSVVCPLTIVPPTGYHKLVNYWNNGTNRPSRDEALVILTQVTENLKAQNCLSNQGVTDAMFRQIKDKTARPYTSHTIPGIIAASDYDFGYANVAYADNDSERTGEEGKKATNKGGAYRNEGVDIEPCADTNSQSVKFNLCHIEDGEWTQYTIAASKKGRYKLAARVAADNANGIMNVDCNGQTIIKSVTVLNTAGTQQWQTIQLGNIELNKGTNTIKVISTKGGYNLQWLQVSK